MKYVDFKEFKKTVLEDYKGIKKFRLFTVKQMIKEVGHHVHSTEWHQLLLDTGYQKLPKTGWYLVTDEKGIVRKAFYLSKDGATNPDFEPIWFTEPKEKDEKGMPIANFIKPIAWMELPKPYNPKKHIEDVLDFNEGEE